MSTSTFNYQEYLASREWALLREQVRARSGGTCERCHKAPHQDTHHLTYERVGHERLEDLLGVCRPCHEFLSGKSDMDPAVEKKRRLAPTPLPILPVERSWLGPDGAQLHCPVCVYEYVHITSVGKVEDGWVGGSTLRLECRCENGCSFALEVGSHKGGTFFRVAPEWNGEPDDALVLRAISAIWPTVTRQLERSSPGVSVLASLMRPGALQGAVLVMRCKDAQVARAAEVPMHRQALEHALATVMGHTYRLVFGVPSDDA